MHYPMTEHSRIGGSSYSRWSQCPGSVRLSKGIESKAGFPAAEGTVAHKLSETPIATGKPTIREPGDLIQQEGFDIEVTQEMLDGIQLYADTVRNDMEPGDELYVERKVHVPEIHPNLFGTLDTAVWRERKHHLKVYDFKYGKGVGVEAENNQQGVFYALLFAMSNNLRVKDVEFIIVQPRFEHPEGPIRRWRFDAVQLLEFQAELEDAVERVMDPEAPLVPGKHCQWCPAGAICPEVKRLATNMAKKEFESTALDTADLADSMRFLPVIERWTKQVREFAYQQAMDGVFIPGFKLVEKRGIRKWVKEETVATELQAFGLDGSDMFSRKLKSPAAIEKLIGKQEMKEMDHLHRKESSGLTLVPEADKRHAIAQGSARARLDFAEQI
jgi:hypothetical protein